jgi:hypothetical protein
MRRGVVGGGTASEVGASRRAFVGVVVALVSVFDFGFDDLAVAFDFFLGEVGIVVGDGGVRFGSWDVNKSSSPKARRQFISGRWLLEQQR